jgi:predicted nuclease of restriction endonuclease-like RecB superfamily
LGGPTQELGDDLYGDLPQNHILVDMEEITPEGLLRRYNLALAQGILYRALRMRIEPFSNYKPIFRYIKLAGLIYLIEKILRVFIRSPSLDLPPSCGAPKSMG